jgi:uncharacterized protein
MELENIRRIADKLHLSYKQINNTFQLHQEGATIPFMARYRKEATGNLDEVQIGSVINLLEYFSELDKRKETVMKTVEASGKLTLELKFRIERCFDAVELEDIYLPYKPKRRTKAAVAMEKGLEPLAKLIFEQGPGQPEEAAQSFISEQVGNAREALQGASDIMAEWISEREEARGSIRALFNRSAMLYSKIIPGKKDDEAAQKYRDYFQFSESLSQSPSHRILAIRRGEKEGFLGMDIQVQKEAALTELEAIFLKGSGEKSALVKRSIADSFDRLLKPSIENEFRLLSKTSAEEEAIKVFAENLRQLLLAAPLGSKRILAIDPGYRTGCKVVCLDAQGNFLYNSTIYPHSQHHDHTGTPPQKSVEELRFLVDRFGIEAIGIGNGTAGRETESIVRGIDFGKPVSIFMVNESGASIYSASELAREEFPEQDVTVRGSISIGRRLMDPLSELVKIDPKSIGVGQYQHDVNQSRLKDELDRVVESCVNFVGVDLNTASKQLLTYVSGLSATLANNIVNYRKEHGPFGSREELKKVSLMGPKTYEQCAGFLRIRGASHPLDGSAVHPEAYHVVEAMARDLNCSLADLIRQGDLRKKIDRIKYLSESVGEFTIEDILQELEKPGRDPRSQAEEFRYDETIRTIEDLRPGMSVPGIVTNITNFGAFVDIGVKQDGLVHVSRLSERFVSDPNEIVKLQQRVQVTVIEVDAGRKRISLSMVENAHKSKEKSANFQGIKNKKGNDQATGPGRRNVQKVERKEGEDDFASKLTELKKKFKR